MPSGSCPVRIQQSGIKRIVHVYLRHAGHVGLHRGCGPEAGLSDGHILVCVQSFLGTDWCRYGNQDSTILAKSVGALFWDQTFPAKVKIGVSGCPRCCGESHTRDIGILGTNRGWTVLFGGNGGRVPRFADIIARNLTTGQVLDCVQRLAE